MNNATTQELCAPSQTLQQEMVFQPDHDNSSCRCQKGPSNNHTVCRPYITRGPSDIRPEDFLPVVYVLLPSKYELFSKILATDELWQTFRQKAAEAFCKADKKYFLEYSPAFPFCFADLKGGSRYNGFSKIQERMDLSWFSLDDLAEIAEKVILELDNNPHKKFQEKALVMICANCCSQDLCEIPQIDVSMLMPCYPGQLSLLAGVRICAEASPKKHSVHTHIDLLFRVHTLKQFLEAIGQLQSIGWRQEVYQRLILSDTYPIQTVPEDRIDQFFPILTQGKDINKRGEDMISRKVIRCGVRINGKWYWDEALYGLQGSVLCGEPAGDRVDIYNKGMQFICTAKLLENYWRNRYGTGLDEPARNQPADRA